MTACATGSTTVFDHPQGYGLGNAGTTAQRFDVKLQAGESNYTELGVETGLAGAIAFIAWSLALLAGLVRTRPGRATGAAAAIAAALAAVLALAIQTDVIGVPWLAYCLWWLAGSLVYAKVLTKAQLPASSHSKGSSATVSRSA